MEVKQKYDAHLSQRDLLLRPKTGLKDMIVELDPGTPSGGRPLKRRLHGAGLATRSRTSTSTRSSRCSTATRARTCSCCSTAPRRASRATARDLAQVFRRFEPTRATRRKITKLLAERRRNIRRVDPQLRRFTTRCRARPAARAASSTAPTRSSKRFANQDANLQRTIALLPAALARHDRALAQAKAFADQAGPALAALRPGAARSARRSRDAAVPPRDDADHRDQLRPFTRVATPVVKSSPAAANLADATPNLAETRNGTK